MNTLGTRGFFSRATRCLVGRRPTRLRPKTEDTSDEAARKNLWRIAPSFIVLDLDLVSNLSIKSAVAGSHYLQNNKLEF